MQVRHCCLAAMMIFILVKVVLCGCALYHCFVLQRLIKSRFFDEWSLPCAFEDTDAAVDDMESDEFPTELLTSPALHESRLLQLPKNHPSVPLEQECVELSKQCSIGENKFFYMFNRLGAIFRGVEQNGCLYGTQACDVDHIIAGISEKQHSNYRTDLSNDRIIVDKHEYDIIDRLGDTISVDTGECYSKDLTNAQQDIHRNAYALLSSVFNRHEGSLSTNATTPMVLHWPINCCVLYRYILATEVINEYSLVQAVVDTIVWRYSFFQPSTAYKMDAVTYVNQIKIPSVVLQEAMRYAEGDEERTLRHGRWSAWMNGTNNVCRMSDEGRMLRSVANKGKDSIGPPVALMYYRNPYPPDTLPLDANAGVSSVSNVNAVNGGDFFDVTPQAQQSLVVYIKHLPPGYEINAVEIKAKDLLHNIHFFHSPNLVSSDIYTESVVCAIERCHILTCCVCISYNRCLMLMSCLCRLDSNLRDLQCNDITGN